MDRAVHEVIVTQEGLDASEVGFQQRGHDQVTPTFRFLLENSPLNPEV